MDYERLKALSPLIPRDNLQVLTTLQEHYENVLKHEIEHTRKIAEKVSSLASKDSKIGRIAPEEDLSGFKGNQTPSESKDVNWAYAMSLELLEQGKTKKMDLGEYLKRQTDILRTLNQ